MDVREGFGRAMADEVIRLSTIKGILLNQISLHNPQAQSGRAAAAESTAEATSPVSSTPIQARRDWFGYLQELLFYTRVYSATDPRDKIYAILGIAKRGLPPECPCLSPQTTLGPRLHGQCSCLWRRCC